MQSMKFITTSIFILLSFITHGQTKRVLFLGNSYTYVNNLPQLIADVAASNGDSLIHDSNTPGGYTLQGHSTNTTSLNKIMQGNWDFVIMQEQSQRPSFPLSQVQSDVFPYAQYLDSVINANNTCVETMFYMTWGRKNGDSGNCLSWPPVCTYSGMDSLLRLRYMMMADMNDAVVSPVGSVWRYIRNHYPNIDLYSPDESHPSAAGSYAAACSFYAAIFRKDPTQITFDFSLNATDAANIRTAAKEVVIDSLAQWFISTYDLTSAFSNVNQSGLTYQFTNMSQNATGQIWNFISATDTSANPDFTFPGPGSYTVQLTTFNACDTVISSQVIIVTATSLADFSSNENVNIYPNPASSFIYLDLNSFNKPSVIFYNIYGEVVVEIKTYEADKIDISFWDNGVYFMKLEGPNYLIYRKIIISK